MMHLWGPPPVVCFCVDRGPRSASGLEDEVEDEEGQEEAGEVAEGQPDHEGLGHRPNVVHGHLGDN